MTLTFNDLERLGKQLAQEENLILKSIAPFSKQGIVGTCNSHGEIKIRMQNSSAMFPQVRDQENLRTLAHEIAHLKHMNHSKEFWSYAAQLCELLSSKVGFKVKPEQAMIL